MCGLTLQEELCKLSFFGKRKNLLVMSDAEIMAMSGIADAALQVAGNITASTFNYEHTKELAKYQNDMNIANWKMANEYNSPKAQLERYMEAGLNPNLMYGQGSPGNASSIPSPAMSNPGFKNPFAGVQLAQAFQQAKGLALQNENQVYRNSEEKLQLLDRVRRQNAISAFIYDHTDHSKVDYSPNALRFRASNVSYVEGNEALSYYNEARLTSWYKELELLWQRGVLNSSNIGLIEAKRGALGFSEEKNSLLKEVLQGDLSGDSMKKLFTLLLLNLLESGTSSSVLSTIIR